MIDVTKVTKAYSGKPRKCMCGCSGTYWYASGHPLPQYYDQDDVNDKQVKRIVNLLNNNAGNPTYDTGDNYAYVEINNRAYAVYFD